VLGAGANKPYHYPTGEELRTEVLQGLKGKFAWLANQGMQDPGHRFGEALIRSRSGSVDAFLEHRREFEDIGKLAMASVLMDREDEQYLFSDTGLPGDWITYLLSAMGAPFDLFGDNAVSFITFNYDRVLAHVLFNAVKGRYGESDEQCATVVAKIRIVHVHGTLGPLPWQESGGRPYGPPHGFGPLMDAARRIKIVYEGADSDPEFEQARALIREAKRIYFLGFGFHKDNVERLHLGECKEGAQISGSTFGLFDREVADAARLLAARLTRKEPMPTVQLSPTGYDCLQFLRHDPARLD
jgi:hypothetical protein